MFALDTNTVIHFLKEGGMVLANLARVPRSQVAIPSTVVYELEVGTLRSTNGDARRVRIDALLRTVTILPFGREEAEAAARVQAALEASGQVIGPRDTLIAGTCLAANATLVTRNTREFGRVQGLKVVSWYE